MRAFRTPSSCEFSALLGAQRRGRINARRAARRQIGGGERDREQHEGDRAKGGRIVRLH